MNLCGGAFSKSQNSNMTDLAFMLGIALSSRPYLVLTQGGNTSVVGNNTFLPVPEVTNLTSGRFNLT